MKALKHVVLCLTLGALTHATPDAAGQGGPVTRRGSEVVHLLVRTVISPTDFGPSTAGAVRMQYNRQGQSTRQSVDLFVTGLEPNSEAGLTASVGEDTNVLTVANFTTDSQGRVRASYVARGPNPARLGRKQPLPELMDPLSNVKAICIENSAVEVVGFAWVYDAPMYKYIVKRNLTPEGDAQGSINLTANQRRTNLRLLAGGLTPNANYNLVLNGENVGTYAANENGRLTIRGWPQDAPPVLQLRSLALVEEGGGTVLSTALPE